MKNDNIGIEQFVERLLREQEQKTVELPKIILSPNEILPLKHTMKQKF